MTVSNLCEACALSTSSRYGQPIKDGDSERTRWICADCFLRSIRYVLDVPSLGNAASHASAAIKALGIVIENGLAVDDPKRKGLLIASEGFLRSALKQVNDVLEKIS